MEFIMNRYLPFLVLVSLAVQCTAAHAAQLLTYNSIGAGTATLLDPTVNDPAHITNALEIALGSGAIIQGGTTNDSTFTPTSDSTQLRYSGQNSPAQTLAAAVANNQHFDITFEITGSDLISLDSIEFDARVNTNNAGSPARWGAMAYHWQQSINASAFSNIGSDVIWDTTGGNGDEVLQAGEWQSGAKSFSVDISSTPNLSPGDDVTLRLVFRSGDNVGGGGDGNAAVRFGNVIINGSVVPEPSTFVLAALGLLGLIGFGRRRRR